MTASNLHMIAYTSQATTEQVQFEQDVADIVCTAKTMNPQFGITGALFFHDGVFMQVIEGKQEHLNQLVTNIRADNRHKNVEVLVDESVDKRGFSDWNMDYFNLSDTNVVDAKKLQAVARDYKENLMLRADVFVKFYKIMLEHCEPYSS